MPEVDFNNETGRSEVVGKRLAGTRLVHYIPFSKETVEKIIAKAVAPEDATVLWPGAKFSSKTV